MAERKHKDVTKNNWRGFTLQLFLVTILPLTILLVAVALGSQAFHQNAMRKLVGDRDLQTVRAASDSIGRELSHLSSTIRILSRSLGDGSDLTKSILSPDEISSNFDGGIALFGPEGQLLGISPYAMGWDSVSSLIMDSGEEKFQVTFTSPIYLTGNKYPYVLLTIRDQNNNLLVGGFSPAQLVKNSLKDLIDSSQMSLLVIGSERSTGSYDVIFQERLANTDLNDPAHPGIRDVLEGNSGVIYFHGNDGEHVVAYSPIPVAGWGLLIEENWEKIASPTLVSTQLAPLLIIPVLLLTVLLIWFGARRIVTPLQNLEKKAASMARGNFDEISQPVGGITEIRNLQDELVDMAQKVNAAQHRLRSYIGEITSRVESERRSLARELHDDTIQSLVALNQRVQMISSKPSGTQKESLSELQSMIKQIMSNLRRVITGLRPIYLEDLGLVASLEMLILEMSRGVNMQIKFASLGDERHLDPQLEMTLYRMVQESVNNIIQHSNAAHANVEIKYSARKLVVLIKDDGQGFQLPTDISKFTRKGHFGLLGLQERAELIQARLKVISRPHRGTTVSIQLPLSKTK